MSAPLTTQLVATAPASAKEASLPSLSVKAPASVAVLPTPTAAEMQAYAPVGGPANTAASVVLNADPVVQQLMSAQQAKRRLEATLNVLSAQLRSERLSPNDGVFA
jgi:hypothetical protein